MSASASFPDELDTMGFALIRSVFSSGEITKLTRNLETWGATADKARAGVRIPLRACPAAAEVAQSPALCSWVASVLGTGARAVRAILFDKTPSANWKVAWHQDLTIAVEERHDVAGFSAWTEKEGVCHVQPPAEVLEEMVAARIHLDDCDGASGPLRVLPGTHRAGRLDPDSISAQRAAIREIVCTALRGDVLLMRPLLLHASSAATSAAHRRVLHLEYSARTLPGGLRWEEETEFATLTS